ncbi:MAG TPA: restriction endonuclease subunit S [Bacteroidetes bacterium]|nr:restriction endonuclease subunit S [Bacteroidota bacterium]
MKTLLKDITKIQTGLFAKPSGNGEVVYLQSKHFDENGHLLGELHPDLLSEGISQKHLLKDGDVLFAAKGTKNFAAVYEGHNPTAVASTSFFVIRLTDTTILPEYLMWFLNHPTTQTILKNSARGTDIPSIRKSVLEDLEISIPSLAKQRLVIRLATLAKKEYELRLAILQQRKQFIEQQIINALI